MNTILYQALAARTEKPLDLKGRLNHGMLGVITEAGELGDAIKKYTIYEKELDLDNIEEEIGDLFWYVAVIANATGVDLGKAMERNIAKLRARYPDLYSNEAALARADKA